MIFHKAEGVNLEICIIRTTDSHSGIRQISHLILRKSFWFYTET